MNTYDNKMLQSTEISALPPSNRVLPPGKRWVVYVAPKPEKKRPGVKTKLGFFYYV